MSSGVFGLGLASSFQQSSFIQNLFKMNAISEPVFSLYLNDKGFTGNITADKESTLIIGGYDLESYAKDPKQNFTMHNVFNNVNQWILELKNVTYDLLVFNTTTVIIDQGFSYIAGPQKDVEQIYNEIKIDAGVCVIEQGFLTCNCENAEELPSIRFTIDDVIYSIDSSKYQKYENNECFIYIIPDNGNHWVLGQIFLREYYSLWDLDKFMIGFTPVTQPQKKHSTSENYFSKNWVIALIVVISLLFVGVIIAVGYLIYKKKTLRRDSNLSRDSLVSNDRTLSQFA